MRPERFHTAQQQQHVLTCELVHSQQKTILRITLQRQTCIITAMSHHHSNVALTQQCCIVIQQLSFEAGGCMTATEKCGVMCEQLP